MMINIFEKVLANNGHVNTYVGILVVFIGLIAISLAIVIFNKSSNYFMNKESAKPIQTKDIEPSEIINKTNVKDIPEDELVAIATAVEIYRKIHFDMLQNEITFIDGINQTPWKMLQRNRKTITRVRP